MCLLSLGQPSGDWPLALEKDRGGLAGLLRMLNRLGHGESPVLWKTLNSEANSSD